MDRSFAVGICCFKVIGDMEFCVTRVGICVFLHCNLKLQAEPGSLSMETLYLCHKYAEYAGSQGIMGLHMHLQASKGGSKPLNWQTKPSPPPNDLRPQA